MSGEEQYRVEGEEVQTIRFQISYRDVAQHGECSQYFIITINGV